MNAKISLVNDTIAHLEMIIGRVNDNKYQSSYEFRAWSDELKNLYAFVSGDNEDDKALIHIAKTKISEWENQLSLDDKALLSLEKMLERAYASKRSFELFDETNYLMSRISDGSNFDLANPDSEIKKIRKTIFEIEGYEEVIR